MYIGIAFSAILALGIGLSGLAASTGVAVPPIAYFALGVAAIIINAIKDQLGIRDASTAAIAKVYDPTYPTHREDPRTGQPPTTTPK